MPKISKFQNFKIPPTPVEIFSSVGRQTSNLSIRVQRNENKLERRRTTAPVATDQGYTTLEAQHRPEISRRQGRSRLECRQARLARRHIQIGRRPACKTEQAFEGFE